MKRHHMVIAAAALSAATSASAAVTYDVSGSFKAWDGASFRALLGGGSFDGSFVMAAATIPTSGYANFVSYSINLRNSSGTVVEVLTQAVGVSGGYFSYSAASTYGGPVLNFYEVVGGRAENGLFLVVPNGFNGTGGIVAGSASSASVGSQEAKVTSARIAPRVVMAVPEASTWAMMVVGFGVLGAGLRTRRRTVAFSA